jgi:ABC-type antimicrobial peptide transport system permease subunit
MPGQSSITSRIYIPTHPYGEMLLIKYKTGENMSRNQVADLINEVDRGYSIFTYHSLEQLKNKRLFRERITVFTTASLAILTFLLAGIGLYGILSYSTQMRQFEIGTRLALGAKRGDVIKLIIKDNASAILLGVLLSVGVLSLLTIGFSEQVNHYITLQLLPVFIVTLAMISMLSLFACYFPLRQYINKPVIHSLKGSE